MVAGELPVGVRLRLQSKEALARQVSAFRDVPLEVLFLSHLDDDHVSGVDWLLAETTPREVVLPYLSDHDWAFVLASEFAQGRGSRTLIDIARDPTRWFAERGVRRVTFVEVDEEGDDPRSADTPDPGFPSESGEPSLLKGEPERRPESGARTPDGEVPVADLHWSRPLRALPDDRAEARVAPLGAVASIGCSQALPWVLAPYAHRPSAKLRKAFRKALSTAFPGAAKDRDYTAEALTSAGRSKLRGCFDKIWATHNLVTMALYSGPVSPARDRPIHNTAFHGRMVRRNVRAGWLGFGDFNTSVAVRRQRLLTYYGPYLGAVGQLTLPHHGADNSCDPSLLKSFPNLWSAVASAGQNSYGHPGQTIQAAVHAAGLAFLQVDEHPGKAYCVRGTLE
jgi:hypothetical protein